MDLKVSLDNITITAEIRHSSFNNFKKLVSNHIAIITQKAMTDMFQAYTKSGGQVILHLEYDKLKGQARNARPFRMEFNPNKLRTVDTEILNTIIPYLEDISITRADLAFDFFNLDCSEFILEKKGRPTATKEWRDKNGKLETKYLGASRSEKQIRLYDKKVEQLTNGSEDERQNAQQYEHWWRLEFQLRSRSVENIFEVIDTIIFKPFYFESLEIETQLYLLALTRDKGIWNKVSKNTRSKYKKILETHQTSDTDYLQLMKNLLHKERPKLEKQLAFYGGR
ncbi:replication initiation protein [Streptococcus sp. 517s]|uniref:Replication initiation protein n=1 Tax=Streptococcus oralis subsp. dentisani TaxID=1458253 RepID=A0A1X1IRJ4_STROR|nr:replication initiation protein [Streptococcus oralis]ORO75613.1 replication initiation protein [Streptococcus oralis subsp. dentisani]